MTQFKGRTTNAVRTWNANLRLKVNDVVDHLGSLYQNTSGKNSEPGVNLDDWAHLGISNDNLLVHKAGEETISGKKIFTGNIEVKSVAPEIKIQETINDNFVVLKARDLGDASISIKNQDNMNLLTLTNKIGLLEPQLSIGDTSVIPSESQVYVFGGTNGANIDMRGKASRDECNMDFEGNDWETDIPNSLGFSYFGNQYSLGGNVLGYPKSRLAHIRFNEADHAIITSTNQLGVVPIRFGINGTEIANLFDKGIEYESDFSVLNASNPRWLTDKNYVDSPKIRTESSATAITTEDKTLNISSGTFTVTVVTAVGNSGRSFNVSNNGNGIITLDPNGTETINGNTTYIIPAKTGVTIQSDGSNWVVINKLRNETLNRTQWIQSIALTTINNASSLNLLTLISDANKSANGTDGGIYELSVATDKILTKWYGQKMTHHIRISSTIVIGTDQHYILTLRRYSDNSILGQVQLNRNADTGLFTADFLTYTYSDIDPFVTGGFYISFDNNSGASVDISGNINLFIVTYFQ